MVSSYWYMKTRPETPQHPEVSRMLLADFAQSTAWPFIDNPQTRTLMDLDWHKVAVYGDRPKMLTLALKNGWPKPSPIWIVVTSSERSSALRMRPPLLRHIRT